MTEGIEKFTTEELKAEIKKRSAPKELDTRLFLKTKAACRNYVKALSESDGEYFEGSDLEHHIFEAAMEETYGENIWDWVNDEDR